MPSCAWLLVHAVTKLPALPAATAGAYCTPVHARVRAVAVPDHDEIPGGIHGDRWRIVDPGRVGVDLELGALRDA
jgi:hypothetical protein